MTLRDEHIEVIAEVDLFLLVGAGPTAIATGPEAEVAGELERLRMTLETGTHLFVDGAPVPLELRGLLSPPELRAFAATLSAAQKDHGELVRLRFEAPQAVRGAKSVSLSLPPALGPIVVSFVQPATRYARPGESAMFDVLVRPSKPSGDWSRTGLAAALLLILAGAATVLLRRRFMVLS